MHIHIHIHIHTSGVKDPQYRHNFAPPAQPGPLQICSSKPPQSACSKRHLQRSNVPERPFA